MKSFRSSFSSLRNFWLEGVICTFYTVIAQPFLIPGIRNVSGCSILTAQSKLETVLTAYFCFLSPGALSSAVYPFQLLVLAADMALLPLAADTSARSFHLAC